MDLQQIQPQLNVSAGLLAAALVAYAAAVEPLWGRREYARLRARRDDDPNALVRMYRLVVGVQWVWALAVLAAVAVAPGLHASDVGLTAPHGDAFTYGMTGAVAAGLLASSVATWVAARDGRTVPGQDAIAALLPRTARERRYAAAGAVTAGVCEELLYRGFFIAAGIGLLGLPVWAAAVLSLVVFVLGHIYQGLRGVLAVSVVSVLLTLLYVESGSLVLPIALHVLVDLRGLLIVPAAVAPEEL